MDRQLMATAKSDSKLQARCECGGQEPVTHFTDVAQPKGLLLIQFGSLFFGGSNGSTAVHHARP